MSDLAKRLENLREEKGWTKTAVAKKLGVNNMATYANWEYGTREPDAEMISKIASLFEVSTDYLLGRNKTPEWASNDQIIELDKILQSKVGMAYNDGEITDEDREAIDNMIAGYFWNKKNKEDNRR